MKSCSIFFNFPCGGVDELVFNFFGVGILNIISSVQKSINLSITVLKDQVWQPLTCLNGKMIELVKQACALGYLAANVLSSVNIKAKFFHYQI